MTSDTAEPFSFQASPLELNDSPEWDAVQSELAAFISAARPLIDSAEYLASASSRDAEAGVSRDPRSDILDAIRLLRAVELAAQMHSVNLAVAATQRGISIKRAADSLGISVNTLRKRLPGTSTSLTASDGDHAFF